MSLGSPCEGAFRPATGVPRRPTFAPRRPLRIASSSVARYAPLVPLVAGALLLIVAEFVTVREIVVVTVVPPDGTDTGGSLHAVRAGGARAGHAADVATAPWCAARGPRRSPWSCSPWPPARSCCSSTGRCWTTPGIFARTYDQAQAQPATGFYLESLGAALALVGAVAALVARAAPAGNPARPARALPDGCPTPMPSSSAAPAAATATRSPPWCGATARCCCAAAARWSATDRAADAAQDAVLTAMLSLDRLRRPASFGAVARRDRPQRLPRPTKGV